MRLTKIQVTKLFGVFDHTIPLNLAERITIIHGPNGFGKTAMLQMVQSLLGNRFARLRRVPFESFILNLEDGRELSVTKKFPAKTEVEREESSATLLFELKTPGQAAKEFPLPFSPLKDGLRIPLELIDRHIEELERVGHDNRLNVVEACRILEADNFSGTIGIVDADFNHLEGETPDVSSVFQTDMHDGECFMLSTVAFDKLQKTIFLKLNSFSKFANGKQLTLLSEYFLICVNKL